MEYNQRSDYEFISSILFLFENVVFLWLLVLFICTPFIELALLLKVHEYLGTMWTLAIVVVTAITGWWLARSQGLRTYRRIREELATGRMPQASLVDAIMIFVAGAFLFTPGVLTDLFGLSLLLPQCRAVYRQVLARWFRERFQITSFPQHGPGFQRADDPDVVDSYMDDPAAASDSNSESTGDR